MQTGHGQFAARYRPLLWLGFFPLGPPPWSADLRNIVKLYEVFQDAQNRDGLVGTAVSHLNIVIFVKGMGGSAT